MKITKIAQQQKDPNRVSVFVDGVFSFSLTLDQLLEQKLKKDVELQEVDIVLLKKLSADGKLRTRALEWLLIRPHSTKELRDYLYKKQADPELSASIVTEFTNRGYVDDQKFAIWFIEQRQRKQKSSIEIIAELSRKGIDQSVSRLVLQDQKDDIEVHTDQDSLRILVAKLRNRPKYVADQQKFMRYLASKGFRFDDIKEALRADGEQD